MNGYPGKDTRGYGGSEEPHTTRVAGDQYDRIWSPDCIIVTHSTLTSRTNSLFLAVVLQENDMRCDNWEDLRFLKHSHGVLCGKMPGQHGKNTGASFILVHTHTSFILAYRTCTRTYTQNTHIQTFLADEALSWLLKRSVTLYVSLWWVRALQLHTQLEPHTLPHLCHGGFVESVFFLLCV